MSFLGTYLDLEGQQVGGFRVVELCGRDHKGAPVYRVLCGTCQHTQAFSHAKLQPLVQGKASQVTLRCANSACPLSRHDSHIETINDFRRRDVCRKNSTLERQPSLKQ